MRQRGLCNKRNNREWDREEYCEYLEGYQLWECLVDVSFVAEAQSEELDRDPKYLACEEHIPLSYYFEGLESIDVAQNHQKVVHELVCSVVEEHFLKGEGRVHWDVEQAQFFVRNVRSVFVNLVRSPFTAFPYFRLHHGAKIDIVQVNHFNFVFYVA